MVDDAVYYLDWDRETGRQDEAQEFFHDLHGNEDTLETFDQSLYRKVRELDVDADDPEEIWKSWNSGSGFESREFRETRFCERCETYQIGRDEAVTHAVENHGYPSTRNREPEYIHGPRSMSVGDVVELDETYHLAKSFGWDEVVPE